MRGLLVPVPTPPVVVVLQGGSGNRSNQYGSELPRIEMEKTKMREPEVWINRERMKWHVYELEKRKLRLRENTGESFDWDFEMAQVIERLRL